VYGLESSIARNRDQFLRVAVIGFIAGMFFDGLANIFVGVGMLSTPMNPYYGVGGRLTGFAALAVVYGLLVIGASLLLYPYMVDYRKVESIEVESFRRDQKLWMVVLILGGALFFLSIAFIVMGAYTSGVAGLIGIILGMLVYLSWSRGVVPPISTGMMLGVFTILTAIFLAIAGFSGSIIVGGAHLGVFSIALFLVAVPAFLSPSSGENRLREVILLISLIVFSATLIVGGALGLWSSAGSIGRGGLFSVSAAMGLIGGIASLLAGIMILILELGELAREMQQEAPPSLPPPPPTS